MSISTEVEIKGRHDCGLPQGVLITFDADMMFDTLLLDEAGLLWEIPASFKDIEDDGEDEETETVMSRHVRLIKPTFRVVRNPEMKTRSRFDGPMTLQDEDNTRTWTALFRCGVLQGVRPGYDRVWSKEASMPAGAHQALRISDMTMKARGLPDIPSGEGSIWCIHRGELHTISTAAENQDRTHIIFPEQPHDFHGWIFLDDQGVQTAMRLVAGYVQWRVSVVDNRASAPETLSQLGSEALANNLLARKGSLAGACPVLPTDYTTYGGDAVRWDRADRVDADCSSGCRWWRPLHDDTTGQADGDWGVCSNPTGPRRGLLTWEHQAGRGCFKAE